VPSEIPSIAGLITEQRHQLWIQRYLNHPQANGNGTSQLQASAA
jgi:hypothetical protein